MKKSRAAVFFSILVAALAGVFAATLFLRHDGAGRVVSDGPPEYDEDDLKGVPPTEKLLDLVRNETPREALALLAEKTEHGRIDADGCHEAAHEIGHAAYGKYGDFAQAMEEADELCNSGYIHGILEEYFSGVTDIVAATRSVCDAYLPSTFRGWECYHGVGHGVMFATKNELPQALALCDAYDDEGGRSACSNGVFMENFSTDQKNHRTKYLDERDPLFPCATQAEGHKSDCYFYAPTYFLRLHPAGYEAALRWCESAEPEYREICASGVGSQTMKEHIDDPAFTEDMCMHAADAYRDDCVRGMTGLRIFHFGSLEPAERLCEALRPENEGACQEELRSQEYLFR